MNIFRLALELFVIYMLYKLIFEFIIPVYKTTRKMKEKMGEMQQKMQEQQASTRNNINKKEEIPTPKNFSDDYIEYEEVK